MRLALFFFLSLNARAQTEVEAAAPQTSPRRLEDCQVQTYFEHTVATGSCFSGEVMTGVQYGDPSFIRCSKVRVRCPSDNRTTEDSPSHN